LNFNELLISEHTSADAKTTAGRDYHPNFWEFRARHYVDHIRNNSSWIWYEV